MCWGVGRRKGEDGRGGRGGMGRAGEIKKRGRGEGRKGKGKGKKILMFRGQKNILNGSRVQI